MEAFLYGEQIGRILIQKARTEPAIVLTDCSQMSAVQDFVEMPVIYVPDQKSNNQSGVHLLCDNDDSDTETNVAQDLIATLESVRGVSVARWSEHEIGRYRVAIPEMVSRSVTEIVVALKDVSHAIDFLEPFERIRLAVEEAQKAA